MSRVKVSLVGRKNEKVKKIKPLSPDAREYQELYDAAATTIDKIKYELVNATDAEDCLGEISSIVDNYLLEECV